MNYREQIVSKLKSKLLELKAQKARDSVEWSNVVNKPLAYNPLPHTHSYASLRDKPRAFPPEQHEHAEYALQDHRHSYNELDDVPNTYPPTPHHHAEYASIGHKHDERYARIGHNHDNRYAFSSHGHSLDDVSVPEDLAMFLITLPKGSDGEVLTRTKNGYLWRRIEQQVNQTIVIRPPITDTGGLGTWGEANINWGNEANNWG